MGFVEVALKAKTIVKLANQVKNDIDEFGPEVLILVDYAGFNLRIAKWAKAKGIRVVYFIPPKIWAWKESRLKSLMQNSDEVLIYFLLKSPGMHLRVSKFFTWVIP